MTEPTAMDFKQVWRPALLFTASRALVLLAFVVAGAAHPGLTLHAAMTRWDGGVYLRIAHDGYQSLPRPEVSHLVVFFPAWPILVRSVGNLPGLTQYRAALAMGFGFGLAAACCVWFLTRELVDADAADRATALFVFAPGAFVLSMTYSEPLFVLCAATACWAFIRKRWILGGFIAAVGTATRPDGLAIVLAAACGAYLAVKHRREWRAIIAVPLAASGFVAYQLYLKAHTGNLFAYTKAERKGWHNTITLGTGRWADLRSLLRTVVHGAPADWNHIVPLAGMVVFVAGLVVLIRWRPPIELLALSIGLGIFAFTSTQTGFRPRAVMVVFPLWMALGVRLRRGPWFAVVLASSAALLVALSIISVTTHYITP